MKVGKHLYDYVKYRSGAEKEFIERLEASKRGCGYMKNFRNNFISPLLQDVICRNGRSLCTGKRKGKRFFVVGKKPEKIKTLISQNSGKHQDMLRL